MRSPGFKLPDFKMPHIPSKGESVFVQVIDKVKQAARQLEKNSTLVVTHATPSGETLWVQKLGWDAGILILQCVNEDDESCHVILGVESLHLTLTFVEKKDKPTKDPIGFVGFMNELGADG